jgi:16S rRNA G966 N2-methylase RsmD
MSLNTLKKIFPEPHDQDYIGLLYDIEGLYSITYPKDADLISQNIIDIIGTNKLNIIDMTAGCGGNMISFSKYFLHVTGIELNKVRFNMLRGNLIKYKYTNYKLICGDCTKENLDEYDVIYIDPQWGGPNYKNNSNLELYLSNIKLYDFISPIKNKLVIIKVPYNYNIDNYENHIIKKIIINNIQILFIRMT